MRGTHLVLRRAALPFVKKEGLLILAWAVASRRSQAAYDIAAAARGNKTGITLRLSPAQTGACSTPRRSTEHRGVS